MYGRYFSHKSYTASRPLKNFLAILSLAVGQGGPLDWAYVHRLHHKICEHELDYHSPYPLATRGFVHAQATWMVTPAAHVGRSPFLEDDLVGDITRDPDLDFYRSLIGNANQNRTKAIYGMVYPPVLLGAIYNHRISYWG